ncbi:ABC transporter protein [Halorhabdus tiamatea SARL4B]|uniref:ABC transporter protein n=1 Tax=Halorhabdus tiamatea SARL4B TaxID=1033806 RepID=F7PNN5_9EURY|nr:ABC transporter ATP-binding protein [Halorhabdus tiamatea]ERJ05270.1 ABC transporter protein [Halorhabdus tiamatea SARL4B]CCQ33729.1 ABC transporter, ATP-binding protein [Halorhabdus tiamatea SARL4B]
MKDREHTDESVAVSVSGLTKTYTGEDGDVMAVDGVSFDIPSGQVVGLLGPNGAGKTTTVKAILGLVTPTSGTVSVHGIPVHEERSRAYTRVSAVLEGARNVYWRLTVRENLAFFAGLQGIDPKTRRAEHDDIIETLGLEAKADEPVRNLSRGMKQKVAFGCTLARETPTLFLDEPMLGLDVTTTRDLETEIRRLARQEDKTIVLTSHDMDVIQAVCDRVIVLDGGRVIADDSVENLLDAFEAQTYRVRIDGGPAKGLRETLAERFRVLDWDTDTDTTTFELALTDSDEFFACVNVLDEANVSVQTFTEIEPNLEDIFVDLVETTEAPLLEVPQ